ncbi:tyrosine-type recombinase/integrase [Nonomuraea sp. LP-02]|uniref:tyrosine-type recombinase/integrase n=1 Tax=Nonomuraea sp. LP-02 TaxID=3097960 RepID=UPI002E3345D2|nr:tyrosine-type recombinase/integrase [Nonomuraea sp. LP-02]MED7922718.1 tyrosine-type recombinase/integrase [Nonomuraea sp. LP-02]
MFLAEALAKPTPDTTFHDLRHTFASTALASGVPISEVSKWLGHESITTTVDLYGHLVPEASARAGERALILKGARSLPGQRGNG